jgi:hypothetical protein
MINDKLFTKLTKTIPKKDIEKLQDLSVFREPNGTYSLFNKYKISKTNGLFYVEIDRVADKKEFNVLKNAVAWCTYDKRNRINDSERILHLDIKLSGIEAEIEVHQKLVKRTKKTEEKLIYLAKLGEEKMERKRINDELTGYVYNSRNWQENRFNSKSE